MNQEKIQKIIKVRDKNDDYHNWIVYEETEHTYKIYAECDKGYITEIYKCTTDYIDGVLYSCEIKNPFPLLPKEYMKAEFIELWAKSDEC
jgi:hypothetical protein